MQPNEWDDSITHEQAVWIMSQMQGFTTAIGELLEEADDSAAE